MSVTGKKSLVSGTRELSGDGGVNPIDIGSRKQLFVDERFVASSKGIEFTANPPKKAGLLELEVPSTGMVSIVEHDGRYYMYYRCADGAMVVISEDGINWRAPEPGSFGKDRDVPLPGLYGGGVFIDPRDDKWPFKGIFVVRKGEPWGLDPAVADEVKSENMTMATMRGGPCLFRSRDGMEWEMVSGQPVPFLCDTQNQAFFDVRLNCYVAYLRAFPTLGGPLKYKRCVARTETTDLYQMPWPYTPNKMNKSQGSHDYPYIQDEMPIVMSADSADPPNTDLYNPAVTLYPWADDVYLAFPSLFRCYSTKSTSDRDLRGKWPNGGLFEVQMCVSRDGVRFERYRQPYIRLGLVTDTNGFEGEIDRALCMMGVGMIRSGDSIFQYYCGNSRVHGAPKEYEERSMNERGIFRVVQRLDGFVSVDADHKGGELVTLPIVFKGKRLNLNADCSGMGEIWVEIQDVDGEPVAGYSMKEAVSIDRNGTKQEVWWNKGPGLKQVSGKPVRLRIRMRSAKLYAFQFTE